MPFNIGPFELLLVLILALLILGPGKLPEVGNALGKTIREFRQGVDRRRGCAAREPIEPAAAPPRRWRRLPGSPLLALPRRLQPPRPTRARPRTAQPAERTLRRERDLRARSRHHPYRLRGRFRREGHDARRASDRAAPADFLHQPSGRGRLGAIVGFVVSPDVIRILKAQGGITQPLIFTSPGGAFFLQLKLALMIGIVLGSPIVLYELWAFISPGLTPGERRTARPWIPLARCVPGARHRRRLTSRSCHSRWGFLLASRSPASSSR